MTTVGLQANVKLVIVSMEVKWRWINMVPAWTRIWCRRWTGPIKLRLCVPAEPLLNSLTQYETSQWGGSYICLACASPVR